MLESCTGTKKPVIAAINNRKYYKERSCEELLGKIPHKCREKPLAKLRKK